MVEARKQLEDIERWAESTFPHDFELVKKILEARNLAARQATLVKDERQRTFLLVEIGVMIDGAHPIYACSKSGGDLRVVYFPQGLDEGIFRHANIHLPHVCKIDEVFDWIRSTEEAIYMPKTQALISYLRLCARDSLSTKLDYKSFQIASRGACRAIAEGIARQAQPAGMSDPEFE